MAQYTDITIQEMAEFLAAQGFQQFGTGKVPPLPKTTEIVFGKLIKYKDKVFSIRVYTGIEPGGHSREVGKDAIRVTTFGKNPDGTPVPIGGDRRVHRVKGWKKNLQDRIDRATDVLSQTAICSKCGRWMILRTPQKGQKWQPFLGCTGYPECKNSQKPSP
jgi:hypothetical protein